jgi:uncharacterized membrane protein
VSKPVDETAVTTSSRLPLLIVSLLAVVYALYFGAYSLMEYWSFQMHALDMGNMSQAAWNTLHGHPFYFTNMREHYFNLEAWGTTTRLSFHVEYLFPLISLAYLVYPHPESLLVLQTLAIASGGVAVYRLARDVLGRTWLGVVFACAYFLHPSLEALNLYEFHPVSLATPLLLWAFWCAWRRWWLPFVVLSLMAVGTKEQIGLTVFMLCLYVGFFLKQWKVAIPLGVVSAGWALAAALVIEKHYRTPGTKSYLHTRYGYLGHGIHGVLDTVLHHPDQITSVVFTWAKVGYLAHLLLPTGFLSLLSPFALAIALPSLALNIGSESASMYSALGDNSAEIISVTFIAAILGARALIGWIEPRTPSHWGVTLVAAYVLVASIGAQWDDGFTPIGYRFAFPTISEHDRIVQRFVDMVPAGVPVSAQDQIDPHFSDRHYTFLAPDVGDDGGWTGPKAQYLLLDVTAPSYPLPSYQIHDRAMGYLKHGWGVKAAQDGVILLQRGLAEKHIPPSFYTFASAKPSDIQHRFTHAINVAGYSVHRTDLTNHRVPSMQYTFYFRLDRRTAPYRLQPVIIPGSVITPLCASNPLGLAWWPSSRWKVGRLYAVRLDPIETFADAPQQDHGLQYRVVLSSLAEKLYGGDSAATCGAIERQDQFSPLLQGIDSGV